MCNVVWKLADVDHGRRFGELYVLFNNVATMPVSALHELRVEDWEETIDINIKGVLYGIVLADS